MPNGKTIRWNNNGYTYIGNSNNQLSQFANYSDFQEVKTSVSNGKSAIASAITDKGVSTASDATFQTMANNIRNINIGTLLNFNISNSTEMIDLIRSGDPVMDVTAYTEYALMAGSSGSSISSYLVIYVNRISRSGFVMYSYYNLNAYPNTISSYFNNINLNGGSYTCFTVTVKILNNGDSVQGVGTNRGTYAIIYKIA